MMILFCVLGNLLSSLSHDYPFYDPAISLVHSVPSFHLPTHASKATWKSRHLLMQKLSSSATARGTCTVIQLCLLNLKQAFKNDSCFAYIDRADQIILSCRKK